MTRSATKWAIGCCERLPRSFRPNCANTIFWRGTLVMNSLPLFRIWRSINENKLVREVERSTREFSIRVPTEDRLGPGVETARVDFMANAANTNPLGTH